MVHTGERMNIATLQGAEFERRAVLRFVSFAAAALAGTTIAGLPLTARADAPAWPKEAFAQKAEADAVKALYGKTATPSDKISLDVPEIAENGAVVPVSVSVDLPGVTSIALLVPENPFTLAASYQIPEGTAAAVACRLKMAKTSDVVALVEAGGQLHSARKQVKVTLGGCGG